MLIAVIDTETTGDGPDDQVIELAASHLYRDVNGNWMDGGSHYTFVMPTVPIKTAARAVHHITDEDLEDALTMKQLVGNGRVAEIFDSLNLGPRFMAAHNMDFDYRLLTQSLESDIVLAPSNLICTYRCARQLWPDLEKFGNQFIRYELGLDAKYGPLNTGLPPHRALPDTLVTSWIVQEMLELKTPEELVTLSTAPIVGKICNMGKHAGKPWTQVLAEDRGYLQWILRQGPKREENGRSTGFDDDMLHTCRHYLGLLV